MYVRRLKYKHWTVLKDLISLSRPDVIFQLRAVPVSNVWEQVESLDVPGHATRCFYEVYFPGFQNKHWRGEYLWLGVQRIWKSSDFNNCFSAPLVMQLIWKYERSQTNLRQIAACRSTLSLRQAHLIIGFNKRFNCPSALSWISAFPVLKDSKRKCVLSISWPVRNEVGSAYGIKLCHL